MQYKKAALTTVFGMFALSGICHFPQDASRAYESVQSTVTDIRTVLRQNALLKMGSQVLKTDLDSRAYKENHQHYQAAFEAYTEYASAVEKKDFEAVRRKGKTLDTLLTVKM